MGKLDTKNTDCYEMSIFSLYLIFKKKVFVLYVCVCLLWYCIVHPFIISKDKKEQDEHSNINAPFKGWILTTFQNKQRQRQRQRLLEHLRGTAIKAVDTTGRIQRSRERGGVRGEGWWCSTWICRWGAAAVSVWVEVSVLKWLPSSPSLFTPTFFSLLS